MKFIGGGYMPDKDAPKAGDMRTREEGDQEISEYFDGKDWVPAQTPSQGVEEGGVVNDKTD